MSHLNPFLPDFTYTFFKHVDTGSGDVLARIPSHHLKQSWTKTIFLMIWLKYWKRWSHFLCSLRQFILSSDKKMRLLFMLVSDLGLPQKCILKHCACVLLYWLICIAIHWFEFELIWIWIWLGVHIILSSLSRPYSRLVAVTEVFYFLSSLFHLDPQNSSWHRPRIL